VQIIWIPVMKLNRLVWHMEHSCHCLFEWMNEWMNVYLYTAHITWCLMAVYNAIEWDRTSACEWKAQVSPLRHHLLLLCDELPIVFVHRSILISSSHVPQYNNKHWQVTFCFRVFNFYKKQTRYWAANDLWIDDLFFLNYIWLQVKLVLRWPLFTTM